MQYSSETGATIETSGWCYKFRLFDYSFRPTKDGNVQSVEKLFCLDEVDRFNRLFNAKNYLSNISWNIQLFDAFTEFFEEKARLSKASIQYDNLLDTTVFNPTLRPKNEILAIIKKQIKELD